MTISLRMPDGFPATCPVCGATVMMEPSQPSGDAPCPSCGRLLWFVESVSGLRVFEKGTTELLADILERLGIPRKKFIEAVASATELVDLLDSLDAVELIMELDGTAFELADAEADLERIHTFADLIDYLQEHKRRQ
jgi:acyl carrier protein